MGRRRRHERHTVARSRSMDREDVADAVRWRMVSRDWPSLGQDRLQVQQVPGYSIAQPMGFGALVSSIK